MAVKKKSGSGVGRKGNKNGKVKGRGKKKVGGVPLIDDDKLAREVDSFFEEMTQDVSRQIKQTVDELISMPKDKAKELFSTAAPIFQEAVLGTFPELRVKFALGVYPVMRIDDEKYLEVSFPSLAKVTEMLGLIGGVALSAMTDEILKGFLDKVDEDEVLFAKVCRVVFKNYEEGDERYVSFAQVEGAVRDFFTALRYRKYMSRVRWNDLESKLASL
jgi:hypothetical protein